MSLTPPERRALAALDDELRADDPALAAALTTDPPATEHANPRPRGWVRDELSAQWRAFSPAVRLFFSLLPVGLVLSVSGAAVGSAWMMMLGTLVFLGATGCTVYEARARRRAP